MSEKGVRTFGRLIPAQAGELRALVWAFAYFFCLLASYYMLRPVREEMGIQGGVHNLQWLFSGTFVTMLAAVPLFGRIASVWPRNKLLPAIYGFFSANLGVFYLLMKAGVYPRATASVFFVWLSVFVIFVVSVFWSFMADIFSNEQARRLYGPIAAGGSTGAIAGPAVTAALVKTVGIANLLLVSALLLLLAIVCIRNLSRWAEARGAVFQAQARAPVGGTILGGVRLTFSSTYLLGMAGFILLIGWLNTFVYFEQARMVAAAISDSAERTRLFAQMDLAVNALGLFTQLVLTKVLVARFGVTALLSGVMVYSLGGFLALSLLPVLMTLVLFQVTRRAAEYAVIRPVREVLFTVVTREEKYKAKNFIDTVVFRGGDAVGAWFTRGMQALGASPAQVAMVAMPFAAVAAGIAWFLGQKQEALRREREEAVPGVAQHAELRPQTGD